MGACSNWIRLHVSYTSKLWYNNNLHYTVNKKRPAIVWLSYLNTSNLWCIKILRYTTNTLNAWIYCLIFIQDCAVNTIDTSTSRYNTSVLRYVWMSSMLSTFIVYIRLRSSMLGTIHVYIRFVVDNNTQYRQCIYNSNTKWQQYIRLARIKQQSYWTTVIEYITLVVFNNITIQQYIKFLSSMSNTIHVYIK